MGPVVIKAKILLQQLWLQKLNWDQELPENIALEWVKIKQQIINMEPVTVPRWMGTTNNEDYELHGFCDSSEMAYAAAIYIRNNNGSFLICAKTKVAPVKKLTIPRLELCGAYLLSALMRQVLETLEVKPTKINLWSDSKIVLAWINGNPKRWTTFVMNKVIKINENINKNQGRYVPTKLNPADCATRGICANELKNNELWWKGPNINEIETLSPLKIDNITEERHVHVVEKKNDNSGYFVIQ